MFKKIYDWWFHVKYGVVFNAWEKITGTLSGILMVTLGIVAIVLISMKNESASDFMMLTILITIIYLLVMISAMDRRLKELTQNKDK